MSQLRSKTGSPETAPKSDFRFAPESGPNCDIA